MKIFTNAINKNRLLLSIFSFVLITTSFASGIENSFKNINNESLNFINPSIVKVELDEPTTLGKIIDHGIPIIERNNDFVVFFATNQDIIWL